MTDFNYKKYSLEKLEEWMHDAMSCDEITPQEVFDVIKGVAEENYYHYKHSTSRAYELLALLNGNGKGHIQEYDESETTVTCDQNDPSPECKGAWNDFWQKVDSDVKESIAKDGYDWTPIPAKSSPIYVSEESNNSYSTKEDKVIKWRLNVQVDGLTGECYINLPDDLLEAANLNELDQIEWVDNGDGSALMRKL